MYKRIGFCLLALGALASPARAQTCTTYPPYTLTNGTVADATQVMQNFLCAAPLVTPTFSGGAAFDGTATSQYGYWGITIAPTYSGTTEIIPPQLFVGIQPQPANTGTGTVDYLIGTYDYPENSGTGSVKEMRGSQSQPINQGGGSVTNMYGFFGVPYEVKGPVTGTMYGVYSVPSSAGTTAADSVPTMEALYGTCINNNAQSAVANCYELFLDSPTLGAGAHITKTYGVYQNYGPATNYFAGNVGIGTPAPTSLLHTVDSAPMTASYTGVLHRVTDTSSTGSVNKIGMDIESTGTWNGPSAVNTGLVVNATGGTTNYSAHFNGPFVVNADNGTATPGAFIGISLFGQQSMPQSGTYFGIDVSPTYNGSGTLSGFQGIHLIPQNTSTGTVTMMQGVLSEPENTGGSGSTVNTMRGVAASTWNTGGGSVTTMEALYGNCNNSSGSGANCYELYLDTPTGTFGTNLFGVYQKSATALNYFAGNVGIGTATPGNTLEVNGEVKVDSFALPGSTAVCQVSGVLAQCTSSLRYKENIKSAPFGLNDVMQMRPVTFKWKGRDENDLGLIAEEVAKINPLFATYKDGKIEGVKYAQLTAVLVGAIKELKSENDAQARELSALKNENAALKASSTAFDRRLDALEAKSRLRNASNTAVIRSANANGG